MSSIERRFAHQVRLPEPSTPEERDRIIGVGMAAILVRMNTGARRDGWVHIRVERLSFVDVTTIRRETTLDFTYPVDLTPVAHMLRLAATPLLPLTLLTKDARVAGFSVQDEDDHRLPVLTRVESSAEAARCLVALARTVAPTDGVTPEVAHAFEQMALLPSADACELLARMRVRAQQAAPGTGEKPFGPGWRNFVPTRSPSEPVRAVDNALAPHAPLLWTLLSEPTLNTLARGLSTQFMLLTPLAPEPLEDRRTLRFGYDDEYRKPVGRSAVQRLSASVREGLGWKAAAYEIEVPSIARAQRYQAEVTAPPTLQIVFAELRAFFPSASHPAPAVAVPAAALASLSAPVPRAVAAAWSALRTPGPAPGRAGYRAPVPRALSAAAHALRPTKPPPTDPEILRVPARASDFLVAMQPASDIPPASQAVVVLEFQASRVGLVRVAPLLGSLIAVLLFIGKGRLSSIRDDATSTLLLAVPTLFAALLARPGEHALATRLLLGTRMLVMITGLATFVAATSLAGGWSKHAQHAIWNWAAWGTLAATALLYAGLLVNWSRSRRGNREPSRGAPVQGR